MMGSNSNNENSMGGGGGDSGFFPEESFQSMKAYRGALRHIPRRLVDRVLARAGEWGGEEETQMRARSKHEMKRNLNWWDLGWFAIGAVIGAGVFVLTGKEARLGAGPAIILSYIVSGFSAMLSVFCYTEFAVEIPVAGGSFAYLRVEMGDFVAFIAAGNIILEYLIGGAALGRSWSSYFATLLNHNSNDFRIHVPTLAKNYNYLDPIAVVVLLLGGLISAISTKLTSTLNWIASAVNMLLILFIIVAGLANSHAANFEPFMPYGVRGVFSAASVLYFAYLGFDAVCTMAEETKNPGRDIPLGLLSAMSITTVLYCAMAVTISLMLPYTEIDVDAPFSLAFAKIPGWRWARYLVALGALKGMTTVILVGNVGQARYLTHIARTHLIPPWFAVVNQTTGTPIHATAIMAVGAAIIAFFSSLDILANLLSISTLTIFMIVSLALLIRRYYDSEVTSQRHCWLLVCFLSAIVMSSAGIATYWATTNDWIGYTFLAPIWFISTLGLQLTVPKARIPKIWGTPLVPWLPSLSIATNMFLMASIDKASYIRFGAWTCAMLVYYFLFGLHASYDAAHEGVSYIHDPKITNNKLPPLPSSL